MLSNTSVLRGGFCVSAGKGSSHLFKVVRPKYFLVVVVVVVFPLFSENYACLVAL